MVDPEPNVTAECPSVDILNRFLSGEALLETSESIALHIDHCIPCQSICESLTLHRAPINDSTELMSGRLRTLLQNLKQLRADQTWVPNETAGSKAFAFSSYVAPDYLGNYRILERIGGGSQGLLFRAVDEGLLREVAIKVIRPGTTTTEASRARFLREARAAGKLRSEHVVPIHQVVISGEEQPYLVMEFVQGESLKQKLERTPRLPDRDIAEITVQIAQGLTDAHARGIIHRDIKPSNILIDASTGRVRITDFGLALNSEELAKMTAENTIAGTPAYMSPEQVITPDSVDHSSDIFSLGVVLYEMLAGELPFRGDVRMTLAQLVHDDPKPPSKLRESVPRDLEVLCLKALSKDPSKRFPTARSMAEELDRWLEGKPILSRPTSNWEMAMRWCKRNRLVAGLTGIVVGLLVTIACVLVIATSRLSIANKQMRSTAIQSAEQRDAALRTLERIIFELQDRFDDQVVDLDLLQLNSLSIAIDGLRKVRSVDGRNSIADLPFAEALRRYGEIILRSGQGKRGESYVKEAEGILRNLVSRGDANRPAMRALAETLWVQQEHVDTSDVKELQEATRWARAAWLEEDASSSIFLGNALLKEARQWLQDQDWNQAKPLLLEAKTRLDGAQKKVLTEEQFRSYSTWLESMDRLVALHLRDKNRQAALDVFRETSNAIRDSEKWSDSKRVLQTQLSMLERFDLISASASHPSSPPAPSSEDGLELQSQQFIKTLIKYAETDSLHFDEIIEMIDEIAQEREDEGNDSSAIRLFLLELDIILARSAQLPNNEEICLHLVMCHLNLAELYTDQHQREKGRKHILAAIESNQRCIDTMELELDDWKNIGFMFDLGRKLLANHALLRDSALKTLEVIEKEIRNAQDGKTEKLERVKHRIEKSIR